ncbi:MAG TPA: hypothetical protein VGH51_03205 [Candidatus Angelobacter sp.]
MKLKKRAAPALYRNHKRNGLVGLRFIHADLLLNPVIFNDEIFGLKSEDELAGLVFHERRNQDNVRPRSKSGILLSRTLRLAKLTGSTTASTQEQPTVQIFRKLHSARLVPLLD